MGLSTGRESGPVHYSFSHIGCQLQDNHAENPLNQRSRAYRRAECRTDTSVEDLMETMGREQVRRIPIVDERGALVGMVAQADVVLEAKNEKKAEEMVENISKPFGKHSQ